MNFQIAADTKEQILEDIKNYLQSYPPMGYSTMIFQPQYNHEIKKWVAEGKRSESCD